VLEHELFAGIRRGAKPVAHILVDTTSEPGVETALAPLGEPLAQLRPVPMGDLLRRRQRRSVGIGHTSRLEAGQESAGGGGQLEKPGTDARRRQA
jgi:hypothetical protein